MISVTDTQHVFHFNRRERLLRRLPPNFWVHLIYRINSVNELRKVSFFDDMEVYAQ